MKTKILRSKILLFSLGLFLFSLAASSQNEKLTKQEQREARKDREFYNYQSLDTLLQNKTFVLEADYLENQYGIRRPVVSDLNFIMVDSSKAILQTGSNVNVGLNGVGGTTARGDIRGLKINKNVKSRTFFIRFTVISDIGIYDVAMNIYANGFARATISGMTRGKLIYDGKVQNLFTSRVYKGYNSI